MHARYVKVDRNNIVLNRIYINIQFLNSVMFHLYQQRKNGLPNREKKERLKGRSNLLSCQNNNTMTIKIYIVRVQWNNDKQRDIYDKPCTIAVWERRLGDWSARVITLVIISALRRIHLQWHVRHDARAHGQYRRETINVADANAKSGRIERSEELTREKRRGLAVSSTRKRHSARSDAPLKRRRRATLSLPTREERRILRL